MSDVISADSTDETLSFRRISESVTRSNSLDRGLLEVASSDFVVSSDAIKDDGTAKDILQDDLIIFESLEGIVKGAWKQSTTSHWDVVSSSTERAVGGKTQWTAFVVRSGFWFWGNSAREVVKS